MYQIKTVTSLTGINTDTIRAWERRYGAIEPVRDGKGRRVYTENDIARLKLLASIVRQGFSIGKIANLDNRALTDLLNKNKDVAVAEFTDINEQIIQALKKSQIDRCEELLRRGLISLPPLEFAQSILANCMIRVGDLWHQKKISIAQEHLFSACVKRLILSLNNNLIPMASKHHSMIFATLSGENHEFGILLTSFLAANLNYSCHYLGTDLPSDELITINKTLRTDVIVISIINSPPSELMIEQLNLIGSQVKETQIWVGGTGATFLFDNNLLPDSFIYNETLTDFYNRADLQKVQNLI